MRPLSRSNYGTQVRATGVLCTNLAGGGLSVWPAPPAGRPLVSPNSWPLARRLFSLIYIYFFFTVTLVQSRLRLNDLPKQASAPLFGRNQARLCFASSHQLARALGSVLLAQPSGACRSLARPPPRGLSDRPPPAHCAPFGARLTLTHSLTYLLACLPACRPGSLLANC